MKPLRIWALNKYSILQISTNHDLSFLKLADQSFLTIAGALTTLFEINKKAIVVISGHGIYL